MKFLHFTCILLFITSILKSQSISGIISGDQGETLPFATVYVKEIKFGTSSNVNGKYSINLPEGTYTILFQSLGYASAEREVTIKNDATVLNVKLSINPYQIATVTISSKAEDPAYRIMRKAIAMAPYHQHQVKEYNAEVYIKGSIKIIKLTWLVKRMMKNEKDAPKEGDFFIQESMNYLHFTEPDSYEQNVKMIRSNFPKDEDGGDDAMQFVNASMYQDKIGEIILPLAPYALNNYNFHYEGSTMEGDRKINKIKVIPKRKSKQLAEGYVYVAENYWNLHRVDLTIQSMVGEIRVQQTFGEVEKNVWLPISHTFDINGKFLGNEGNVNYVSSVKYKSITLNKELKSQEAIVTANPVEKPQQIQTVPKKQKQSPSKAKKVEKRKEKLENLMQKEELTNREMYQLTKLMNQETREADTVLESLEIKETHIVKIDSNAREIDTAQWIKIRPVAFTPEEEQVIVKPIVHDTIKTKNDSLHPFVKGLKAIAFGHSWENEKKKQEFQFSGLLTPEHLRYNLVDGFVTGIDFTYRKSFKNTQLRLQPELSWAFNREVLMGKINGRFRYAPLSRGVLNFSFGSQSTDFNQYNGQSNFTNSISSLFFRTHYMKLYHHNYGEVNNQIDLANGLELKTGFGYYQRQMLKNSSNFSFFFTDDKIFKPNLPVNDTAYGTYITNHEAAILTVSLNYTPFYRYEIHHDRKQMVSSKFPTFSLSARYGIPSLGGSDVDFLQVETGIEQSFENAPGDKFSYKILLGGFVSNNKLNFADYKHFNTQEVPVVMGDFSETYELLEYYKYSTGAKYAQGFVNYKSPYLALKYLPGLSNRIWQENLYISALLTSEHKPYWEFGYSMNQIGVLWGIGVFTGFKGNQFHMVGAKISFALSGSVSI